MMNLYLQPNIAEHRPLRYTDVQRLAEIDNCETLELECAKRKDKVEELLHPDGAENGQTIFHVLVELQAQKCLRFLLSKVDRKEYINEPDDDGLSPLHYAVRSLNYRQHVLPCMEHITMDAGVKLYFSNGQSIIRDLIQCGAYTNCRDCYGDTPLHMIVNSCKGRNYLDAISLYHYACAILESEETDTNAVNYRDETPIKLIKRKDTEEKPNSASKMEAKLREKKQEKKLDSYTEILQHIILKEDSKIKDILKKSKYNDHLSNWEAKFIGKDYFTFYLINNFDSSMFECYLVNGGSSRKRNKRGKLALHEACAKGDYKIVGLIIHFMKRDDDYLDVGEDFYDLIKVILESRRSNFKTNGVNHLKCLKRLLKKDIKCDKSETLEKAVALANSMNDFEALMLLKNLGKQPFAM